MLPAFVVVGGGPSSVQVVVKGDGATSYAKVRQLFALVQDRGFSGVSLQVQKKKGRGPETAED